MANEYSPPRRPSMSPPPRSPPLRDRSASPRRERDGSEDRQPVKRVRTDRTDEEKARGRRMFGNILGTLQRFQKDDKTTRQSEAAKRREQVASRIEAKLRSETTLHADIQATDKELRALKVAADSAEYVLRHKTIALAARHQAFKPMSRFLVTSLSAAPPFPEPALTAASPIPLASGPRAEPSQPLYYRPKLLLPDQAALITARETEIADLVVAEQAALDALAAETHARAAENRARIAELGDKLAELRRKKGGDVKGQGEERNASRAARDGARDEPHDAAMDVDGGNAEAEREREREHEAETERAEEGVQIRGDDGDIEVEY
ncbi:hypothetical protein Q5752_001678 [Cryptotrichosporon argae]